MLLSTPSGRCVRVRWLANMARLIERVRPAGWSEHLAFVRAAGVEVGHLAMPPRTPQTVEQTVLNVEAARAVTGLTPALENIATLFDPPMSTLAEAAWSRQLLGAAQAPMLLDLHNLYANAVNAGRDPLTDLAAFPLERVRCVHLSGGMWISHDGGERRLESRTTATFDVVLERDGHYPSFDVMLEELDRARAALNPVEAQPERRYA